MPSEEKQLQAFLKKEKIYQKVLAHELGINQSSISRYIRGELSVPLSVIKHLHHKHKMSYSWFFDGTGNRKIAEVERKTLVSDIGDIRSELELLVAKVAKSDKLLKELHADFHEYKALNEKKSRS